MKAFIKISGVVLALVMLFATVAVFSARTISGILGDADNDGAITILDATRVQRVLVGLYDDSEKITETLADSDGNGLDIMDATRIQRYLAGFSSVYPIGERQSFEIADPTEEPTEEPAIAPTEGPTEEPTDPPAPQPTKKDPYELPLVD